MKPETRKKFFKFRADSRNSYQVFDPAKLSMVKDLMEVRLAAIQASNQFLKAITKYKVGLPVVTYFYR